MNGWLCKEQLDAFESALTTAHRLFTADDAWVERFGADIQISFKTDAARDSALRGLREWEALTGFKSRRVFSRFLPKQNAERVSPVFIEGDPADSLTTVVSEAGVRYGIDFAAGYSVGFFMDQRANRAFLRRIAPRNLLNTFAYTCSFSVVAALAGGQTLSVDLSKKSLDRGRENFALNGLADAGHRFVADDAMEVLPRLERRGEKFDAIVLDPPTFSLGNRGRRWKVEEDLEELVMMALGLAAPNASVLVSTNCTRINRRSLEGIARFALKAHRRGGDFHREPTLPDFPPREGAETLWLRLGS